MPIGMQPSAPARVERLMINLDTQMPMVCGWDECDKLARTPYQVRVHEHVGRCESEAAQFGRHAHYVFCCQRHLDYWVWSSGWRAHELEARYNGRIRGYLPPGSRFRRLWAGARVVATARISISMAVGIATGSASVGAPTVAVRKTGGHGSIAKRALSSMVYRLRSDRPSLPMAARSADHSLCCPSTMITIAALVVSPAESAYAESCARHAIERSGTRRMIPIL